MTYENPFLRDFAWIYRGILEEKQIDPAKNQLIIIDEEVLELTAFTKADVWDVLEQLWQEVNALTIYTERPEAFEGFAEMVYREAGLLAEIYGKKEKSKPGVLQRGCETAVVLDFEKKGAYYNYRKYPRCGYIPIYKKPWQIRENLDIIVPFGYNTVIVKRKYTNDKIFVIDRFDEGFYRDE